MRAVCFEMALDIRSKPLNRNEKKILTVTCFGHFMSHFNTLVFPALILPLSRMYDMGPSRVLALPMALAVNLPLVLATMAYSLFLMGMQPAENTPLAWLTPAKLRHSGFGVKFILTFGVGSLVVRMVGWIKHAWSLPAVYIAMTLISALYKAQFLSWTKVPGIALFLCSDGKVRRIPEAAVIGFKDEDFPEQPGTDILAGSPCRSD